MKFSIETKEVVKFNPIAVTIVVESKEELIALYRRFIVPAGTVEDWGLDNDYYDAKHVYDVDVQMSTGISCNLAEELRKLRRENS